MYPLNEMLALKLASLLEMWKQFSFQGIIMVFLLVMHFF